MTLTQAQSAVCVCAYVRVNEIANSNAIHLNYTHSHTLDGVKCLEHSWLDYWLKKKSVCALVPVLIFGFEAIFVSRHAIRCQSKHTK